MNKEEIKQFIKDNLEIEITFMHLGFQEVSLKFKDDNKPFSSDTVIPMTE